MRCLYPRTVGFKSDGKTICWSKKSYSKEYPPFKLPCGKCIECRLEYARTWAIRCVHEAKMNEDNSFVTLTYNDEHLQSSKLQYRDFQLFIKKLRENIYQSTLDQLSIINQGNTLNETQQKHFIQSSQISIFVTGEYGDKNKRPHWHALIFNWRPQDAKPAYKNERGDQLYTSELLEKIWGKGKCDIGDVTFESAGYVARYAAKKLVHGYDDHEYQPISKKSSKHAIGKRWLEKYWPELLTHGKVLIIKKDGSTAECPIPRYYEKWLLKHHPVEYIRYVTEKKSLNIQASEEKQKIKDEKYKEANSKRNFFTHGLMTTENESKIKIAKEKFQRLQKHLKGDI